MNEKIMQALLVMFPMFIKVQNFFRNSADWTALPGSPLKSGTVMGADKLIDFCDMKVYN